MKTVYTLLLLTGSNIFMNLAWYGHLKFTHSGSFKHAGLWSVILLSWGLAFFEYCLQVPANRIGYQLNGGPFSLMELKIIQEIITLIVFTVLALVFFKNEVLRWNHVAAFCCLVMAVFFTFYKKA